MVRNEISQHVGQRVVINAEVSVPWDGSRVAWCIQKGEVRRSGAPIDHSWIQVNDNQWVCQKVGSNLKRGDQIQIRGVIGRYVKGNGDVDYNIRDIDAVVVNGKGWVRG